MKVPGESDGQCTRGLGPGGETVDPEWGLTAPAAGEWFPQMALDLAHNANPPLPQPGASAARLMARHAVRAVLPPRA